MNNQQLSIFERIGVKEFNDKKYIWKALFACNELYDILASNMDELPNVDQKDLYMFVNTLLQVKYSLIELIGRDSK